MRLLKSIYLLLFFTLIFSTNRSFAQNCVCVSTEPVTGQITISWDLSGWVNIDSVKSYTLGWSLTNWNLIGSDSGHQVNYITFPYPSKVTTYTIPIYNGNTARYYFQISGHLQGQFYFWPASNIFLNVTRIEKNIAKLSWNRDWINSTGLHHVQRLDNGVWNTIYSIPNHEFVWDYINGIAVPSQEFENFSYNDTLTNSLSDTAEIKYRILFKPEYGDCYSVSNIKSLDREPLFFMPNAFKPGGINNKFRPVQSFVESNGFMMQIYDKWGQMIFQTTDIIAGWDGNIKGSIAPAGVYVYTIHYKSLQGGEYDKRGTVMLVK